MCAMSEHLVNQHLIPASMHRLHTIPLRYHYYDNTATDPCYSSTLSKWSSEIRLRAYDHNNPTTSNHNNSVTTIIT